MKRVTKKFLACAQVVAFATLLVVVLMLNIPPTRSDKIYDWGHIRYQTTANRLPEARGICPGLGSSSSSSSNLPVLVVARVAADGSDNPAGWLTKLASRYHLCTYTADAPTVQTPSRELQIPANRGHEAMVYLTFIIDNYDAIPASGGVFIHGSRFAWHNDAPDYDNALLLTTLNLTAALEREGYADLRCDWSASTCSPREAAPQGSLETLFTSRRVCGSSPMASRRRCCPFR